MNHALLIRWNFAFALALSSFADVRTDGFTSNAAFAQPADESTPKPAKKPDPTKLAEQAIEAFSKHDYAQAEQLLRQQLTADNNNFVPHYNLACALALQNKPDDAMAELVEAVQRGFVDRTQLNADPSLTLLRKHPQFIAMLANWPTVLDRQRDAVLAIAEKNFAHTKTDRDEALRLTFVSAFDERSFQQARAEITRVAAWGNTEVFPDLLNPAAAKLDPWVVVVLPNRKDFLTWIIANFGPSAVGSLSSIGGSYDHDAKRLVSQDLGSSLRHEFFHVLHWRDMTRRGQVHPIWVQEGLCSLVEDYDLVPSDADAPPRFEPATSWRTNIAKRLEKNNLLMPIEKLCSLTRPQFMTARPLAMYAQARTLFLYLHRQHKLAEWYAAYTEGFAKDPTGVTALKETLALDLPAMNKDYRAWVRALPAVAEEILPGHASLGIEVDAGNGEGPIIVGISSAARIEGDRRLIHAGDVITAINDRPTREIAELVRVLGDFKPGDTAELTLRHGQKYNAVKVILVAK